MYFRLFELGEYLIFARDDLVDRHEICLSEEEDDVCEGRDLPQILDIDWTEACEED